MIYKTISKPEFKKFVNLLIKENPTFGPVEVAKNTKGKPIYQFEEVHSYDEIEIDYTMSYSSIKNFFLPFKETLSKFKYEGNDWKQEIKYRVHPRVLIGPRASDISGLVKLDKIFVTGHFPSAYYIARRKNTFIIGMDNKALPDAFCLSPEDHDIRTGFNMFCSDIGDKYYISINSSKAYNYLKKVKTANPTKTDDKKFIERKKLIQNSFKTKVDISGLENFLDIEFKSPIWTKWGEKCLSCGTCAAVCPTCYCYGVEETIEVNLLESRKEQRLHSCNLVDFAKVAGGHNFRPTSVDRLKYRYYHQYRGFAENDDETLCVGCNRCGRACLADINPKDVINDLRMENL